MKIILHNYWRSSASQRVRIGLGLKGLAYEYVPVNIVTGAQFDDDYRARNPIAQVPTLEIVEDDGTERRLTQSLPILEYLEDRWLEPAILPRDPYLRARARSLAEIVNAGIQPMQNLTTFKRVRALGGDDTAWIQPFLAEGIAAFSTASEDVSGAFCVGDEPSIADCCLVPQLIAARRFQIDLTPYERLLGIEARCLAMPAFSAAMPHHQPDAVKS
ncbi:MAG: maleylacetoacetate isomerase [Myxococcales bacterium]|nr:maleylacetoacetate isomerase [Myxococcales bacterium]